ELLLSPERFTQGGFSQFSLSGFGGGVDVAAGANVHPLTRTLVLDPAGAGTQPSGADIFSFASPVLLDPSVRRPAGLSLSSSLGNVTVEAGSAIVMDPQASLSLSVNAGKLEVAGTLAAPAGNINLSVTSSNPGSPGTVQIDTGAIISAAGTFVQTPTTVPGQIRGNVLRAGSITIGATTAGASGTPASDARVIVRPGALLAVSGTAADIDIPTLSRGASVPVRTHVTGDAGTITIRATHPSRIDGTLRGSAQGQSAGGALELDFAKVSVLE